MTAPTGRDNGLPAAEDYAPLTELERPLADRVLALLRDAGIPAVAEPLPAAGPDAMVPAGGPRERVHVDRARAAEARALVGEGLTALRAQLEPDLRLEAERAPLPAAEVDQAFAAIVSGLDAPDLASFDLDAGDRVTPDEPAHRGLSARLVRRADDDQDPDPSYWPDSHFVPPVPPRAPRGDRPTRFAWAGVVGGPLVLLLIVTLGLQVDRIVMYAAIGAFIAGFVTLVVRMPDGPDDDGDDGAVV